MVRSGRRRCSTCAPRCPTAIDSGILDVTLDPGFATNGWFYLAYVRDDDPQAVWATQRVVRYTLAGETVVPGSEHVVLGGPSLATCRADATTPGCLLNHLGMHTVDDLLFLPDGSLLVSVGDSAPGEPSRAVVAQRLDVLAGKVLRIDPQTGFGPAEQPLLPARLAALQPEPGLRLRLPQPLPDGPLARG